MRKQKKQKFTKNLKCEILQKSKIRNFTKKYLIK